MRGMRLKAFLFMRNSFDSPARWSTFLTSAHRRTAMLGERGRVMRRLLLSVSCLCAIGVLGPPAAGAAASPAQDRDWCGQVTPTASWSVKNVDVLCRIDTVR